MTFIESNASFLHLGCQLQSSWTTTLQGMDHCIQEPWIKKGKIGYKGGKVARVINESYEKEFGRAWNCNKKTAYQLKIKIG